MAAVQELSVFSAETKEKENRAFELRKAGASYSQIAKALEYHDESGAYKAVKRYIARLNRESSDELRTMAQEQLNDIYRRTLDIYQTNSDDSVRLRALNQLTQTQESLRKLLGLDAPTQITGPEGGPIEVRIGAIVEKIQQIKAGEGEHDQV